MNLTEIKNNTLEEHKILDLGDFEIHYYVSGRKNKDLIIFLHPAFSDHRAFDQQINFFKKNYRVITIDLIGHGLSKTNKSKEKIDASSNHINEILKIEGYKTTHLVGVSMGSLIAQYFAYQNPEKVISLTALGGYNIHKDNEEVKKAQLSTNMSLIFRAIFSMKAFRTKIAKMTCNSKKGRALFYKSASLYERKSFLVMQGLQNVIKERKNTNQLFPILILIGEDDIDLAKTMSKKWDSEIENSNCLVIENAGHCANLDKPKVFNRVVNEFIANFSN